ncbi:glycosyltransferase family 4 protein [Fontisphaera persica]|uniref:glycosyltransferase family 4 protein n=1 Tax=Fontisphaera persica TaxID=2974023 RepID=UPI0024BF23FF|nr:glycosyltransferase family 4 protein [Fontisphaera persica]WCJ60514.1 glycosyltransferase family 4 protein [Fontisphaera persica]
MKILILKRDSLARADGISQFIFSLAGAWLREGHEVVCAATHGIAVEDGVRELYELEQLPRLDVLQPEASMADWRKFLAWRRHGAALEARHQPDLILINGAVPVRFRARTILVAHDVERRWLGPLGPLGRIIYKSMTYRLAAQVVTTCPELVAPVARECRLEPAKITVIPTCIETHRYTARPLSQRAPLIIHLGQQEYKQPQMSLKALALMQRIDARLVVTGKPERSFVQALHKMPAALQQRVELPGLVPVQRLKELLATARAVSIPSKYAHPVASPTALEALASHTPAVCSPSVSSIMARDGETCFVETSVEGMARRFDELFNDAQLWQRLSARCAHIKQQFDAVTVAAQYLALAGKGNPPA